MGTAETYPIPNSAVSSGAESSPHATEHQHGEHIDVVVFVLVGLAAAASWTSLVSRVGSIELIALAAVLGGGYPAGRTVMMMVGDGVNDAPSSGGADVGVATGAELNELALGGADVALLGMDLGRLPRPIGLADVTRRVIGQNIWLGFGLAFVLIALAARGLIDPLTGPFAQSAAVLVVLPNSARILRIAQPAGPAIGRAADRGQTGRSRLKMGS